MTKPFRSLRGDRRAISPAFSTMILTAGVIVMILVAMSYASNILNMRIAENEFATNQQFMRTAGLQIDDIAWIVGRTQTITYSSRFGQVAFEPQVVTYTLQVHTSAGWETAVTGQTGIILYNMPITAYQRSDGYFERVPNSADSSFIQEGSSAPISQVFCVEKLAMDDGGYLRVVVVPTVRVLESANYYKVYLPTLESDMHPYRSQSVTMSGNGIDKITHAGVDQIRVDVSFPDAASGFDSAFFNFNDVSETKVLPQGSVVEFYVGDVTVTIGAA